MMDKYEKGQQPCRNLKRAPGPREREPITPNPRRPPRRSRNRGKHNGCRVLRQDRRGASDRQAVLVAVGRDN